MTARPAAPESETPETDKEEAELEMARGIMEERGVNELPILKKKIVRSTFARSLERRLSLAQTEIKGHMRLEIEAQADYIRAREFIEQQSKRIAELEKMLREVYGEFAKRHILASDLQTRIDVALKSRA